jgi:plasmid stabilization system protein ParE
MPFILRYRTEAQAEVENAFLWFEEHQPGLGVQFVAQWEALDARIAENPYLFQLVEPPDVRRGLFRRFPYALFYRIQGDEIDVLGCFHQHQEPRTREELLARS